MANRIQTRPGLNEDIQLAHTAPWELYHNAFSLCSMKVRVCLAELGLSYTSHHIDLIESGAYENTSAKFVAVNPGMTVPVLVHNGHPIYESHEQIRYAAAQADTTTSLTPDANGQREEMEHWVDRSSLTDDPIANPHTSAGNAVPGQTLALFAATMVEIPYQRIFAGLLRHFDKRRPLMFAMMKLRGFSALRVPLLAKAIATSRTYMIQHLGALEDQLAKHDGPWIMGQQFTLADVSWLVIFERLRQADTLHVFASEAERPLCAAYWTALQARPSYRAAIADHAHPIIERATTFIRRSKAADEDLRVLLEGA